MSIHLGMVEHYGRFMGEEGSDSREECSSPLRHTSLSDDSSSRSAAANDSGYTSMPDDKFCDVMDCAERFPKKRLPVTALSQV